MALAIQKTSDALAPGSVGMKFPERPLTYWEIQEFRLRVELALVRALVEIAKREQRCASGAMK